MNLGQFVDMIQGHDTASGRKYLDEHGDQAGSHSIVVTSFITSTLFNNYSWHTRHLNAPDDSKVALA